MHYVLCAFAALLHIIPRYVLAADTADRNLRVFYDTSRHLEKYDFRKVNLPFAVWEVHNPKS